FPFVLLVIAVGASLRGGASGSAAVLAVLGLTGWTGTARVIRGRVLFERELDYVRAARAAGAGTLRLLLRHILPHLAGLALALATLSPATMILAEAGLAYLGLGAPPSAPSWGRMLREGQAYALAAPWLVAAPGLALLAVVLGFNLLGERLRAALEPRRAP